MQHLSIQKITRISDPNRLVLKAGQKKCENMLLGIFLTESILSF